MMRARLPALPADVLSRIARETLVVEGGTNKAWIRLSLVCGSWRNSLRGMQSEPVLTMPLCLL